MLNFLGLLYGHRRTTGSRVTAALASLSIGKVEQLA
jgi:hypothetical protein